MKEGFEIHSGKSRILAEEFVRELNVGWLRKDKKSLSDLKRLLSSSAVTTAFREEIEESLNTVMSDPYRKEAVGVGFILNKCGIDLATGNFGIFDPEQAMAIEENELRKEEKLVNSLQIPDLRNYYSEQIKIWKDEYNKKYGKSFK